MAPHPFLPYLEARGSSALLPFLMVTLLPSMGSYTHLAQPALG
jgi:hypothetical protein